MRVLSHCFDNAVIAVYANNRGGVKAACLFLSGLIQVGGSAFLLRIGLSQYGGYLGMFDWATALVIYNHYESSRLCWRSSGGDWVTNNSATSVS